MLIYTVSVNLYFSEMCSFNIFSLFYLCSFIWDHYTSAYKLLLVFSVDVVDFHLSEKSICGYLDF